MAAFDPTVHLAYEKPRVRHTMSDLGLEQDSISDVGITEPFRLLTPEGVRALRGDIFSKPVLDNYGRSICGHIRRSAMQFMTCSLDIGFGTLPTAGDVTSSEICGGSLDPS